MRCPRFRRKPTESCPTCGASRPQPHIWATHSFKIAPSVTLSRESASPGIRLETRRPRFVAASAYLMFFLSYTNTDLRPSVLLRSHNKDGRLVWPREHSQRQHLRACRPLASCVRVTSSTIQSATI